LVTGVVLAGGKSVRFGANKALQQFRGKRLIEHAIDLLRPFCDDLLVVANDLGPYFGLDIALAQDIIAHQGPLGGIYTALLFSPCEWIFARATDMPFLVPGLAAAMLAAREGFDAVVPRAGDFYEPLMALYHRRCCPAIADFLEREGERKITNFYKKIKVRYFSEEEWRAIDPGGLSFRNANTPEDLAAIDGSP